MTRMAVENRTRFSISHLTAHSRRWALTNHRIIVYPHIIWILWIKDGCLTWIITKWLIMYSNILAYIGLNCMSLQYFTLWLQIKGKKFRSLSLLSRRGSKVSETMSSENTRPPISYCQCVLKLMSFLTMSHFF